MHQITHQQRTQQILNRVAQTRIGVLESAAKTQAGAGVCMDVLHISRKTLRYAAMAAVGYAGLRIAGRLIHRAPRPAQAALPSPKSVAAAEQPRGLFKYLIAQLFTIVLLPWVKEWLSGSKVSRGLDYWRPSRIFFRWIGLER